LVVAVCEHVPQRLGIAFAPVSASGVDVRSVRHLPLAALGENVFGRMEGLQSRLPNGSLSARQCEILTRLVQGQSAQDIATALYLSPTTVRNHLSTIYKKFGVHSQGALLAKFIDMRWALAETAV
jgi:DNA-binding NarL/FixJ family response regulator